MQIRKLRCSFCRMTEDKISKLVAGPRLIFGPRLYICDKCVAVANSIMQGNPPPTPTGSRSLLQKERERWCHLLRRIVLREASVAEAP
jgi:ATP-dependent protease Clp ATPase subunit